ncbi:MAG TPA: HAMP domain-containing sensor histidine kinase [Thermomicrobiales bacterium]|nr:HAMP domain-containing sensor histidine kinase [Thermomicrobiales bacterium]
MNATDHPTQTLASPDPSLSARQATTSSRATAEERPGSFIRRRVPFLFSIRFGLTAWYAGILILTLSLSGIALRTLLVRSLEQDVETRLHSAAVEVRSQTSERLDQTGVEQDGSTGEPSFTIVPEFNVESILLSGLSVTVVEATTGDPLFQGGFLSNVWPNPADYRTYLNSRTPQYFTQNVAGKTIRGLAYPIISKQALDPETGHRRVIGMIFTGESLESRDRVLSSLNQVLFVAGIAGVAIASFGGWLLAGRALAPVNRIMTSADDIAKGKGAVSLSRRIDVPRTGDEIAQLAETFNDMLDRIEAAFAAQRRFVGDASHELRTPLTSIKGNIDVLRRQLASGRGADPQDIADALGDVHRETDRMGRLVDDLLALARSDVEGLGSMVSMDVVSLDVLAQEAARTADALAHGQEFVLHTPEPVVVHGDGDRLVQVMLILLDNAFRHTPPDGKVTLSISTATDPQDHLPCARIDVVDTGKGIAPEHLPHLFERFYRAEGSRSRADGGTGLGLSIALAIVRSHNGWIDVESAPGKGARFTVWIPLPAESIEPAAQASDKSSPRRLPIPRFVRLPRPSADE